MPSRVLIISTAGDRTLAVRYALAGENYGKWTRHELASSALLFYEVKPQAPLAEEIAPKHLYGTLLAPPVLVKDFAISASTFVIDQNRPAYNLDSHSVKNIRAFVAKVDGES